MICLSKCSILNWNHIHPRPYIHPCFGVIIRLDGMNFNWGYVLWCIIALLVWIGLWTKLIIYRVPPNPIKWYCRGFGFLWQSFMLNWMLWTKNYFKVSHSNKLKEPHHQVKCLRKCSILHWNHIHPHPYIHPCFGVISLTIIEILHRIGWFMRRNQNWVIVTLAGAFPRILYPTTIPIKRDPGPHRHHKIVKIYH